MCRSLQRLLILILPLLASDTTAFLHNPRQSVEQQNISYRLPNETYPEHYAIHLKTNIHDGNFSFTGKVEITIVTREVTSTIVIHARQLEISEVKLWNTIGTPTEILLDPFEYDEVTEFVIIRLESGVLQSDTKYLLTVEYNGELRDDNLGFYRSSYRDANNQLV